MRILYNYTSILNRVSQRCVRLTTYHVTHQSSSVITVPRWVTAAILRFLRTTSSDIQAPDSCDMYTRLQEAYAWCSETCSDVERCQ